MRGKGIKIKAAILEHLNSPLSIRDLEVTDLKVGQVLVKILMSGFCGSQLQEIKGNKGNGKFLPHLLGHEGCGIVEEIGPAVTHVEVGSKVVMHWRIGKGIESEFPTYLLDGKIISSGKVTTLSEYAIVSENRLTVVPSNTPNFLGALLGCGLTTALGVVNNEIDLKFGESAVVVGCGGVGLNLLQALALGSANPIIGIDISENKRKLALDVGADFFINPTKDSIKEFLTKNIPTGKIDVVVDTTGNPETLDELSGLLSDAGRLVMVGQPEPGKGIYFSNALNLFGARGKTIVTTQGGKTSPADDIPRYISLYKAGKLDVERVVTHYFDLDKINKATEVLKLGEAGRIMINMGHNE